MVLIAPDVRSIPSGGDASTRVGGRRCGGSTVAVQAVGARPLVDEVEQPAHLEVGQRAHVAQRSGKLRLAVVDAGQPPDELDADAAERIEVERAPLVGAGELQRSHAAAHARCRRLRRSARRARRRHPSTTEGPCRDKTRGTRMCSPTDMTTGRPERRISWAICVPLADAPTTRTPPSASWPGFRYCWAVKGCDRRRHQMGEGQEHARCCRLRTRARPPRIAVAPIRAHQVSRRGAAHRCHRRVGSYRSGDRLRVAREEIDHLGHRAVTVGIVAIVTETGQPATAELGVSSRRESQRSVRQVCATSPRSSTT